MKYPAFVGMFNKNKVCGIAEWKEGEPIDIFGECSGISIPSKGSKELSYLSLEEQILSLYRGNASKRPKDLSEPNIFIKN